MLQNLINTLISLFEPLRDTWIWPGLAESGKFLGTHLISGMVPAFFIAGAIAVFLDKQRITRLMGADANPLISYPVAAFSGGILTVCSCGVIPIFTGIMQQGAGIGPAFTFLLASPAVNLIALSYTYTLLGTKFLVGRTILVMIMAIAVGFSMRLLFGRTDKVVEPSQIVMVEDETDRTDLQLLMFFVVMILIMITATGVFDSLILAVSAFTGLEGVFLPRILTLMLEIILLTVMALKWFHRDEIILWLRKSQSLFIMIFPKVLGGIFLSGVLAALFPLTSFMKFFDTNSTESNLLSATVGALMYFGTIVGVSIVSTLKDFGMHPGPALTLLLSGPAVSLPSILALAPIVGSRKAAAFLALVIIFSATCGFIFGSTF
ncbi:MAG TPA: permease [Candidatus Rifleibacterium sp.]|mgnify:CR=1 FL=1|nr:permease [Candidatus Rifleibacterium sp.]HPT45019.1 permease [Candidatus Rifleibacterium sp.]